MLDRPVSSLLSIIAVMLVFSSDAKVSYVRFCSQSMSLPAESH